MGAWQPDAMYVYIFCFQKVPINFYEMILLFAHRSFRLFISVDIYVFIFLVLCLFITQKYMANNVPASDYPKRPLKDKQLGDINLVQKCTRTICYNQGRFRLRSDQFLLNLGQVHYDTRNVLSVTRSPSWKETVSVENTTSHMN